MNAKKMVSHFILLTMSIILRDRHLMDRFDHGMSEKFAYFSKAVLTILPVIGFQPDIIHCHDWQTGLIPVLSG